MLYPDSMEDHPLAEETMTFRVDGELKEAFKRAAKERNRNASILLRDFMRDYVLKVGKPSQLRVPADKQVQASR